MNNHIRPLAKWKRQNPELYKLVYYEGFGINEVYSAKAQENTFYWYYCYTKYATRGEPFKKNIFWKSPNKRDNIRLLTELGRLLLAGWYYDLEEYTIEYSDWVLEEYYQATSDGVKFEQAKLIEVIKYVRQRLPERINLI
jgi:hypothetical protein